jgi:hypothetical protein
MTKELKIGDRSACTYCGCEIFCTEDGWAHIDAVGHYHHITPAHATPAATWQPKRPTIVCLCGSTRFYEQFMEANFRETMAGKIVLSVGFFMHRPETVQIHGETVGITPEEKEMLDELHLRKIDMADEVLIINVGGYIGLSTRRELAYALLLGKTVRWLEPEKALVLA